MKQLKFRAFANGKMRYDVTGFEHGDANEMKFIFLNGDAFEIGKECEVMQFTSLQDKSGVDVYEGDTIYSSRHIPANMVIKFLEGGYCAVPLDFDTERYYNIDINHFYPSDGCCFTVTGNIHEDKSVT